MCQYQFARATNLLIATQILRPCALIASVNGYSFHQLGWQAVVCFRLGPGRDGRGEVSRHHDGRRPEQVRDEDEGGHVARCSGPRRFHSQHDQWSLSGENELLL